MDSLLTILAFLGPLGTFSEQAAQLASRCLPNKGAVTLVPYPTIAAVMNAVADGSAAYGIVPAENSIEGSVHVTQDILVQEEALTIRAEVILDIRHHLLSMEKELQNVRTVYSHPQALAQCRLYLQQHLPWAEPLESSSTADAACRIRDLPGAAAIASWDSHLSYGIPVLAENIGDYPYNQTRFFLIMREDGQKTSGAKTSLVLYPEKDRPGSLYAILGHFARREINLTCIESRPAKKELGNYLFFIDCQRDWDDSALQDIIAELGREGIRWRCLGSYDRLIPE